MKISGGDVDTDRGANIPVAFEVAAVGEKIRNLARVAGERVAEMDHFVESVNTPIVRVQLPGDESEPGQRGFGDAQVEGMNVRRALERSLRSALLGGNDGGSPAVPLDVGEELPPLLVVEAPYSSSNIASHQQQQSLTVYAQIFWGVLVEAYTVLGWGSPQKEAVVLYHMPTMRADELVCAFGDVVEASAATLGSRALKVGLY